MGITDLILVRPTVISDNSLLRELIPSSKLGFNSDSAKDFCRTLERNLYKNSHKVVGEKIIEYVDFYKWGRVAKDYLSVYSDLT